jgi:hypothetical protein
VLLGEDEGESVRELDDVTDPVTDDVNEYVGVGVPVADVESESDALCVPETVPVREDEVDGVREMLTLNVLESVPEGERLELTERLDVTEIVPETDGVG